MTTRKTQDTSSLDTYAPGLGLLFANLQSLEFLLRLFLYKKRSRPHASFRRGQNFTGLGVGTVLPENALTDYDSLGGLIKRYNEMAKRSLPALEIDHNLVTLRDALAHGRVFVPKTGPPPQLLKFTKPRRGEVRVKFAASLTPEWLAAQNNCIQEAISKLYAANNTARRQRPT